MTLKSIASESRLAPNRRQMLAAAGAMTLAATSDTMAQSPSQPGKTFVLVHGAWHGGWCWRRVADLLEQRGHKVFAPTLTGLGERSHLLNATIDLSTHIKDVLNLIKWEGLDNFVLCGHSYGGMIISGVAEEVQPKIASIVYLDAFLPNNGDNVAGTSERVTSVVAAAKEKGLTALPPTPARMFKIDEKNQAWIDSLCTPQPILTFTDKIAVTGACERVAKKTYIRAKGFATPSFDAVVTQIKDDKSWAKYELPCGHDAMVDMPERVAEILIERA